MSIIIIILHHLFDKYASQVWRQLYEYYNVRSQWYNNLKKKKKKMWVDNILNINTYHILLS